MQLLDLPIHGWQLKLSPSLPGELAVPREGVMGLCVIVATAALRVEAGAGAPHRYTRGV